MCTSTLRGSQAAGLGVELHRWPSRIWLQDGPTFVSVFVPTAELAGEGRHFPLQAWKSQASPGAPRLSLVSELAPRGQL